MPKTRFRRRDKGGIDIYFGFSQREKMHSASFQVMTFARAQLRELTLDYKYRLG